MFACRLAYEHACSAYSSVKGRGAPQRRMRFESVCLCNDEAISKMNVVYESGTSGAFSERKITATEFLDTVFVLFPCLICNNYFNY
jgi:hypothetical protein